MLVPVLSVALLAGCGGEETSAPETTGSAVTAPTTAVPTTAAPTTVAPTTTVAAVGHLRGTAYTFNTPDPIAGATIKVVELPELSAVTGADAAAAAAARCRTPDRPV